MKKLVIFCPESITGGPEALHQLSASANEQGIPATTAYSGEHSSIRVTSESLLCDTNAPEEFVKRYERYKPITSERISLDKETICIFPEILAGRAFSWPQSQGAIWWLSVDNFERTHPNLLNKTTLRSLLRDESIIHLYQSHYARKYLEDNGARSVYPLYDYTSCCYSQESPESFSNTKAIDFAFFPRKGAELAKHFLSTGGDQLTRVPIQGMNEDQVKNALASSRIYIDFGHHPGKDRVPREAACMGNIIFLHEKGAACFFEDHPLHSDYIFTTRDVENGNLIERVNKALAEPAIHFERQSYYRQRIKMEKTEFDWQVKTIFG